MPELPVKIDRTRRKLIGALAAAGAATLLPFCARICTNRR